MVKKITLLFGFIFLASIVNEVSAQVKATSDSTSKDTTQNKPDTYSRIVNKADRMDKGLMNIYYKNRRLYLEVPFDLLGRNMLLSSTISKISNNEIGTVGAKPHAPLWIQFSRVDSVLLLRKMHEPAIAPESDQRIKDALNKNSIGPIIKKFAIKAYNDDHTSAIIDVTNYFLSDEKSLSPFGPIGMNTAPGVSYQEKFGKSKSFIGDFKSFKDNLTIKSHLSYEYTLKKQKRIIAKNEPFTAVMTRTFLLLPKDPMSPRIADPRVGTFVTGKKEYTKSADKVNSVYYTRRFRLIPKDPEAYKNGKLVEPVNPITFYVDRDFPSSWRSAIKKGITDWNDAFEKIGFKNAIRALDYPKDDPEFDPDNLKYNVVRYSPTPVQNAMGPSWIDPRSGEVLNASVYVYHNIVKLINNWRFIQTAQTDSNVQSTKLPNEYKREGLRYVIRHEIGHTLGFKHNMAGSYAIPVDSLRSPTFTQKYGNTYSIMDYARYNYVAQPGDKVRGVKLTPPEFGLYDYFLVKWNYKYFPGLSTEEQHKKLKKMVDGKANDDRYRYGKQQGYPLDPSALTEDLGDNAVKASRYGIKNLKFIMDHLNKWVCKEDSDYTYRQTIWNGIITQYVHYLNHVYANIGGIYVNEKYEGDPRPQYQSVSRYKQQQALRFLLRQVKDLDWLENEQVIRNLPLTGDPSSVLRKAITEAILTAPEKVKLSALKSREKNPYSPRDVMVDIYKGIWEKTTHNATLDKTDRVLQKAYIQSLIQKSDLSTAGSSNSSAFAGQASDGISLPDFVRRKSIHEYGYHLFDQFISPPPDHIHSDPISASFGSTTIRFNVRPSLESLYYSYLMKAKSLMEQALVKTYDNATKMHYRLLLQKIKSVTQ